MKATEHYSPVVLFIMLYKVALTFETVGESLEFGFSFLRLCLIVVLLKISYDGVSVAQTFLCIRFYLDIFCRL